MASYRVVVQTRGLVGGRVGRPGDLDVCNLREVDDGVPVVARVLGHPPGRDSHASASLQLGVEVADAVVLVVVRVDACSSTILQGEHDFDPAVVVGTAGVCIHAGLDSIVETINCFVLHRYILDGGLLYIVWRHMTRQITIS